MSSATRNMREGRTCQDGIRIESSPLPSSARKRQHYNSRGIMRVATVARVATKCG
jgi:hypothetical protein